jgi:hypothetical protein
MKMYGLVDSGGNLVQVNLSDQPFALFETRGQAERYLAVHNSGYAVAEVQLIIQEVSNA